MPMGWPMPRPLCLTRHLKSIGGSDWPDRDRSSCRPSRFDAHLRFALSTGYAQPTLDEIKRFRQLGSPCAGHPENFELPGIEVTTGPLGQGLAMAVGMAVAERHLNAVYGDDLVDHRTFVAGDGCLMEGVNHEAVGLAGHLKLGRLIVRWDDNNITIDGSTELSRNEDVLCAVSGAKWHTIECDGLDAAKVSKAIEKATADERPDSDPVQDDHRLMAPPTKQGTAATHGSALGADESGGAQGIGLGFASVRDSG